MALCSQGVFIEGVARGLHAGGRTGIPQVTEERAPGQTAHVGFRGCLGQMKVGNKAGPSLHVQRAASHVRGLWVRGLRLHGLADGLVNL